MRDFKRAFGICLSVILLFFVLVFAFEMTNRVIEKSGFSSGEVFDFRFEKEVFSGEILGRKFSADFSYASEFIPKLRFLRFLLPPFIRFAAVLFEIIV